MGVSCPRKKEWSLSVLFTLEIHFPPEVRGDLEDHLFQKDRTFRLSPGSTL